MLLMSTESVVIIFTLVDSLHLPVTCTINMIVIVVTRILCCCWYYCHIDYYCGGAVIVCFGVTNSATVYCVYLFWCNYLCTGVETA